MPTTIAVDLAKSVFEVAVSDRPGRVRAHHRLSRTQFSRFVFERPPATILMEACASAHFWGRHAEASDDGARIKAKRRSCGWQEFRSARTLSSSLVSMLSRFLQARHSFLIPFSGVRLLSRSSHSFPIGDATFRLLTARWNVGTS